MISLSLGSLGLKFLIYVIIETNNEKLLPPPRKKATELKKFAAKTIKAWHEKFGESYQLLNLGFDYLKNLKKIDFVDFSHQTNAERLHAQREQEKKQIILNKRCIEYEKQMNGLLVFYLNFYKIDN